MTGSLAAARRTLLHRLLEQYERGRSFGRPAPWPRDVIVRLDARAFPDAFHPDGREALAALRSAAVELAATGCARLVHHRGYGAGIPSEVRLGPAEVEAAYRAGEAEGFERLLQPLATLRTHACELRAPELPGWMNHFLERVEAGSASADLSVLGLARERFKRERRDVMDGLRAAVALASGVSGWERIVSERVFGDSKRLAAVRPHVVGMLVRADPRWEGIAPEDAADLLEAYGVRRKPGLLRCAGSGPLHVAGRTYRLEDFAPAAHLPDTWAPAWIDALASPSVACVTTIENEFPFLSYVEESGGPAGLGARGEVAVYTAGFPVPALVDSLAAIVRRDPAKRLRHWGDADVGGLRIWWLLRTRLEHPLELFRTSAAWVEGEAARRGGTPLEDADRPALRRLREQLVASPPAGAGDVGGVVALIDALLALGIKVEQERY
jgi:hypothetical protein